MTIDKQKLYGTFHKSLAKSEKLTDLATRKALDLPVDDEMQIITNNHTRQGLGRCGTLLLALAMAAGGSGMTLGLVSLLQNNVRNSGEAASGAEFAPQEFQVTFWNEDGQPVEVQPVEEQHDE